MVSVRTLVEPVDFAPSGPYFCTSSSASSRFTHASIVAYPKSRSTAKLCRPSTRHKASSSSRVTVVARSSTFRATPSHCLACSYWSLESGSGPPLLGMRLGYRHALSTFLTSKVTSKPLSPQMSLHCRGRTKRISLNWTSISMCGPQSHNCRKLVRIYALNPCARQTVERCNCFAFSHLMQQSSLAGRRGLEMAFHDLISY